MVYPHDGSGHLSTYLPLQVGILRTYPTFQKAQLLRLDQYEGAHPKPILNRPDFLQSDQLSVEPY